MTGHCLYPIRKRFNILFAYSLHHIRAYEFTADVNGTSFRCCFTLWPCPWWRRHRKKTFVCDCGSCWWRCSHMSSLPISCEGAMDEQEEPRWAVGGRSAGDGPHASQLLGDTIDFPASWLLRGKLPSPCAAWTRVLINLDWFPRQQQQCSWLHCEQIHKPPLCCICDKEAPRRALAVVLRTLGVTMVTRSSRFKDCNYNNHYCIIIVFFFTNIVWHVCPILTLLHPLPSPLLLWSALHDWLTPSRPFVPCMCRLFRQIAGVRGHHLDTGLLWMRTDTRARANYRAATAVCGLLHVLPWMSFRTSRQRSQMYLETDLAEEIEWEAPRPHYEVPPWLPSPCNSN